MLSSPLNSEISFGSINRLLVLKNCMGSLVNILGNSSQFLKFPWNLVTLWISTPWKCCEFAVLPWKIFSRWFHGRLPGENTVKMVTLVSSWGHVKVRLNTVKIPWALPRSPADWHCGLGNPINTSSAYYLLHYINADWNVWVSNWA